MKNSTSQGSPDGGINAQDSAGGTALLDAVSDADFARVDKLIRQGADVNLPENNGTTPLMDAASGGDWRIVALLLLNGADPKLNDFHGDSAVEYASNQGFLELAEFIEFRGERLLPR